MIQLHHQLIASNQPLDLPSIYRDELDNTTLELEQTGHDLQDQLVHLYQAFDGFIHENK